MKLKKRFSRTVAQVLGTGALMATVCTAAPAQAGFTHATTTTIDEVVVLNDGGFYLILHNNVCSEAQNKRVGRLYKGLEVNGQTPNDAAIDRMLRVATAAHLSGSAVRIYAENAGGRWGCLVGAISIR